MNLNEALDLLKKNNYLTELTALPKIYDDEYGSYAKMTNKGREKRNAKITYKDDERYNDHEGTLWLDVKQKDHFTLTLAALSGLIDSGGINYYDDGIKQNYPAGTTMKDIPRLSFTAKKSIQSTSEHSEDSEQLPLSAQTYSEFPSLPIRMKR